jgi:hypothetical protein
VHAATTIDAVNRYSYGANLGWMDWVADTNNGMVVGQQVCSGYIYSANVGWINLGSGAPANGVQYQNNSASDFGVNLDSGGNLRGYAYGANIGWIAFEDTGAPKMDLTTGNFNGYAYSANCGWISLSNAVAFVKLNLPMITTSRLPDAAANTGYTQTLTASNGAGSITWSLVGGTLPAGLSLSSGGIISGTPTTTGTTSITVQATDSNGWSATEMLSLDILIPSTIDSAHHYAYGANLGWVDLRGDVTHGVIIGQFVCSGSLYSANAGWINLGSGAPANGVYYQNNSASDYGVNRDAAGNLRGYAYGANIGWIAFEDTGAPKMDLITGNFSGYAYSANSGWISLSNATASVQSTVFAGINGAAASQISSFTAPGGGSATISGLGGSGVPYTVQANTNLATATWVDIGTATAAAGGSLQFTDVDATNFQQRFYRFSNP